MCVGGGDGRREMRRGGGGVQRERRAEKERGEREGKVMRIGTVDEKKRG